MKMTMTEEMFCSNCGMPADIMRAVRTTGVELPLIGSFVHDPEAVCCRSLWVRAENLRQDLRREVAREIAIHREVAVRIALRIKMRPNSRSARI